MTARRVVPLVGIVFCVGVMLTLMQTGVPLGIIMPPILLLGALALVLLISLIAGQTNR